MKEYGVWFEQVNKYPIYVKATNPIQAEEKARRQWKLDNKEPLCSEVELQNASETKIVVVKISRNNSTVVSKKLRYNFARKNKVKLRFYYSKMSYKKRKALALEARLKLGYSKNTNDCDILRGLYKLSIISEGNYND